MGFSTIIAYKSTYSIQKFDKEGQVWIIEREGKMKPQTTQQWIGYKPDTTIQSIPQLATFKWQLKNHTQNSGLPIFLDPLNENMLIFTCI